MLLLFSDDLDDIFVDDTYVMNPRSSEILVTHGLDEDLVLKSNADICGTGPLADILYDITENGTRDNEPGWGGRLRPKFD